MALGGCGLMAALVTACGSEPARESQDAAQEPLDFTVMSFNVRNGLLDSGERAWTARRPEVLQFMAESGAAWIGTQEVLPDQRDELLAELDGWEAFGLGTYPDDVGDHSALFFPSDVVERVEGDTFWLSETPTEPGTKGWDAFLPRVCTWARMRVRGTGREVFAFNTHLDNEGAIARLEGARLVAERIRELAAGSPVVLTGDFNAAEGEPPLDVLLVDLVDAFRTAHPDDASGTFHAYLGVTTGPRIDFVLVSRHFEVLDAGILPDAPPFASDHYPVTAALRLP